MKVKFKKDNNIPFRQDFQYFRNLPSDIEFDVEEFDKNSVNLKAFGYGYSVNDFGKGAYGNGSIYLSKKYLPDEILVQMINPEEKEKLIESLDYVSNKLIEEIKKQIKSSEDKKFVEALEYVTDKLLNMSDKEFKEIVEKHKDGEYARIFNLLY